MGRHGRSPGSPAVPCLLDGGQGPRVRFVKGLLAYACPLPARSPVIGGRTRWSGGENTETRHPLYETFAQIGYDALPLRG
jgi:hypothetical protein